MFDIITKIFGKKDAPTYTQYRILVVEDNEVDRKIIEKALEPLGSQVIFAHDGQEGYQKAAELKPDLIISDCSMPKMGGIEMCQQIKENNEIHMIPIIFLTSIESATNLVECFESDAENFINKPLQPKILVNQIKQIFNEKESS